MGKTPPPKPTKPVVTPPPKGGSTTNGAGYKGVTIDTSKGQADIQRQMAAIDAKGYTPPKGGTTTPPPPKGGTTAPKGGSTTPSYTGSSVVDYLGSTGKASDYNSRTALAGQYGISGYQGTAAQNTQLLNALRGGSMGTTASVPSSTAPTVSSGGQVSNIPRSAYTGGSVVDYLGSSGQASDFASRAKLAGQYGITNYTGTAEQNTGLLNSLRNASSSGISAPGATPQYTPPTATGTQVTTKSVGGVDYQVTGDPVKDAANLKAAQNEASRIKQAERDRARLQQDQTNTPQQDISNQGLIQQLIALQKQQQLDVNPKINDLSYLRSRNSQQIANTLGSSGDEALQTGRAAIYQQQATAQEGVKQAEIDNILSNYQQRYGALGTGINATMPTQVSPGNSLISPQTGGQVYNGINQAVGYNNLLANQGTGRDLGYQATSIANTISQADANVDLLLQSAGINMTRVTDINELLQVVNSHFGANSAEQVKFQAALEGSIGKLLQSGLFTGDQVQQIQQQGVDKQTPAGMLDFYLAIKNQAINQYNQVVKQGQTYNAAGAGSVIGGLQPMNTIKTGTNLQVSNTPKGATVSTTVGSINSNW